MVGLINYPVHKMGQMHIKYMNIEHLHIPRKFNCYMINDTRYVGQILLTSSSCLYSEGKDLAHKQCRRKNIGKRNKVLYAQDIKLSYLTTLYMYLFLDLLALLQPLM